MTTPVKRRKRNRNLIKPLSERLFPTMREKHLAPWDLKIRPSQYSTIKELQDYEDFIYDDFFEEDEPIPAMNIKEHKTNYEIEMAVPGFRKEDFEISIEGHILHISGENRKEEKSKDGDYTCKEFSYKSFKRSLTIPEDIDLEQEIKASYVNGILELMLSKKETIPPESKKLITVT